MHFYFRLSNSSPSFTAFRPICCCPLSCVGHFRFATTSILKKPPPPGTEEEAPPEVEKESAASTAGPSPPVLDEATQALQRLVDKYQEKTEKEIQRTIKVFLHLL